MKVRVVCIVGVKCEVVVVLLFFWWDFLEDVESDVMVGIFGFWWLVF